MDLLACVVEREMHADELAARGAYAGAQSLQHALSSIGSARRVFTDGPVRSSLRCMRASEQPGEGYAGAQSLQHAVISIGSARRVHSTVWLRSPMDLLALIKHVCGIVREKMPLARV